MSDHASARVSGTSAGAVGVGAAACLACCAGPILGALSAVGIASAVGYLVAGSVAIVVGVVATAFVIARRRRRCHACDRPSSSVVIVGAPAPGGCCDDPMSTGLSRTPDRH